MNLLIEEVRGLARAGAEAFSGTPKEHVFRSIEERLAEPLRVAIAGRVKAGKSTLLNALIGEQLAPTDAGECTKIVTWFVQGLRYRVVLEPRDGPPREVPFSRDGGAIEVDLGEWDASGVHRLLVEWPSASLEALTLIDTPGIASLAAEVSERTRAFLTPDEEEPTAADAVVYLMRHSHASDVRFLEAFHDEAVARATPVNTVAVLSRADELGGGKITSMDAARRIASRYRTDPKLRRLCQTVVPVSGLLAETGQTLQEAEYRAIARLVEHPAEAGRLLLTSDRFVRLDTVVSIDTAEREHLIRRFGLFGLRLAVDLIEKGRAPTANRLAAELVVHSGLEELREILDTQFAARRDTLKARSALLAVEAALQGEDESAKSHLLAECERIRASAHELVELRLLNALRSGVPGLTPEETRAAERILGVAGASPEARLGLDPDAAPGQLREVVLAEITRWRARAEGPAVSRDLSEACRVLERTCEGIFQAVSVQTA